MAGTNVGTVFFKIATNKGAFTKEINSSANYANSAFSKASSAIGKSIKFAFAGQAAKAVINFGKLCVSTAMESQNAWYGLSSIINGQGKDFAQANSFIQSYVSDGLVPLNNAVTAYKNLLARGYDTSQIEAVMTALKDSAAYGRAASYSYGDAIQSATEGLKNENSILVDNAGVTKNVAKMWDDYAKSIGTTSNALTQQQKIQAEVNGILQETKWQTGDAARYSNTFAGRLARLSATATSVKNNIGNLIIPIANVFIPVIQGALNIVNSFAVALQNVFSKLGFEMFDISSLKNVNTTAVDTAASIADTGTAAETAAKKAKKAFASFDEINVLNTSSSSGDYSGSSPSSAGSVPTAAISKNNSTFDVSAIETSIASVTALVSTALLAVGAILTFTGANIPLGIALMAAGAVGLVTAIAINWSSMQDHVSTTIDLITAILSGALLAVGGILALTGHVPLGVGLMVAGAAGLATTVAINWNSTSNSVKTAIEVVTRIVSIALLAIGALIAFSSAGLPLGIALIAAGAVGLVASVALNWNDTTNKVSKVITTLSSVVGGGLIAIGALLTFSGMAPGLGIGLLAAGAVTLAASVAPNWESMPSKVKNVIGVVSGIVGAGLLVLGAILTFSNANVPLGLGLMVAGGATLASAVAPNWNSIVTTLKSVWTSVQNIFKNVGSFFGNKFQSAFTAIKNAFKNTGSFFGGLWNTITKKFKNIGQKIGASMGSAFKKAVNSVFATIENVVNSPIKAINSLIGIINKVPGINLSKLKTFNLPRLAQGGWVAANNPQLAIIGDNTREGEIVTPESKIYEQVMKAIKEMGAGFVSTAVQTVKLAIEIMIKYPDGRTIIKQINEAQIKEGKILLEV